jgi:hypothetical protein
MNSENLWTQLSKLPISEVRKFRAKHDIEFFAREYFGIELYPHHLNWLNLATDYQNNPRVLIEAPKDHGKSWTMGLIYPLWRICKDPDIWIIYVSNTATQAEMHIRPIIYELETNRKLINDFALPDETGVRRFKPQMSENLVWRDREIIINRPSRAEHPTILAVGSGGAILGRRGKLIIGDDLLDKDNSKTPEMREKVKYWHDNELINTLEPEGQEVIIGTPQDFRDLYSDLSQRKIFKVRIDRAIIDAEKKIVLWGEKWDYDRLMIRKEEIGTNYFNMNYQCLPISDETTWFPYSWLSDRCFDQEATLVDNNEGLKDFKIVFGVDLAISEDMGADYFVVVVLGVDRLGNHWLLHIYRSKGMTFNSQINKIVDLCNSFQPYVVYVEDNAYQKALYQELRRKTRVPVKSYTTTGQKKSDIEIGIRALSVIVENGKLKIPRGDEESRKITDLFVNELTDYGKAVHDDILMAWWLSENAVRTYIKPASVSKSLV